MNLEMRFEVVSHSCSMFVSRREASSDTLNKVEARVELPPCLAQLGAMKEPSTDFSIYAIGSGLADSSIKA